MTVFAVEDILKFQSYAVVLDGPGSNIPMNMFPPCPMSGGINIAKLTHMNVS